MHPGLVLLALWILWAVSWVAAARWSSDAIRTETGRQALNYRLLFVVGGLLLAIPARMHWAMRMWQPGWTLAWLCVPLALAGFAFCWWARLHLGALWSASVTIKSGHEIVESGPYGLVRHPIYTGLLIAIVATVLIKGTVLGVVGAVLIVAGVLAKVRIEETFLREDVGTAAYDDYASRVPMLVPFIK